MPIQQKRRLEWFLDFVRSDLYEMSKEEMLSLAGILASYMGLISSGVLMTRDDYDAIVRLIGKRGETLIDLQECLKACLAEVRNQIDQASEFPVVAQEDDSMTWAVQKLDLGSFPVTVEMTLSLEPPVKSEIDSDRTYGVYGEELDPTQPLRDTEFKLRVTARDYRESITYHFLQALAGVPYSSVRWCPECGGPFAHFTKRERIFCSNQCAARKGNRERYERLRKEDAEALEMERNKGRERAHKSYVKKVKKQPGKSNVKVPRRPRDRKKKED